MAIQIQINYWEENGSEYYAAWVDGEHDHNGDIPDDMDAEEFLAQKFPGATIREVGRTA